MTINLSFPDSTYTSSNKPAAATLKADLATLETEANLVDTAISDAITAALEAIYPVGAIFISASATMPSTISDLGTWARIEGKMIVGASDTDGDFDNGDTGGAKTVNIAHTHTGPSHTHTGPNHRHTLAHTHTFSDTTSNGNIAGNTGGGTDVQRCSTDHTHTVSGTTSGASATYTGYQGTGNTGASGTGATSSSLSATQSVMNPYKAKYMWERTV